MVKDQRSTTAPRHQPNMTWFVADTPSPQSATLGLHPVAVAITHFPSR